MIFLSDLLCVKVVSLLPQGRVYTIYMMISLQHSNATVLLFLSLCEM